MTWRSRSLRASLLAPFIKLDGLGGISWSTFFTGFCAIAIGAVMTWLLSSIKSAADLSDLIAEAARRYYVFSWFFSWFDLAIDKLGAWIPRSWAAPILLQVLLFAGPLLVTILGWWIFGWARARWPSRAQDKPDPGKIAMPRQTGGGARVGGVVFGGVAVTLWLAIAAGPWLIDQLFDTDFRYFTRGFVAAGLAAAASFIVLDSMAYWLWEPKKVLAAAEKPAGQPNVNALIAQLRDAFNNGKAVNDLIPISPASASWADDVGQDAPDAASRVHLDRLRKRTPAERQAWLRAVKTFHEKRDNLAILEPLGDIHFAFFVEIMSCVQDQGQSVIVVMPEVSAARITAELKEAFSAHCGILTQSEWIDVGAGEALNKSALSLENSLIFTDEKLVKHLLGANSGSFAGELERAGLLLLFDTHLFDLSQLRVDIAMLMQRTPPGRLRVVAHAGFWSGMKAALNDMVSATGREMGVIEFDAAGGSALQALVFRNDIRARDALLASFFPTFDRPGAVRASHRDGLEPLPLIAQQALLGGYDIRSTHMQLIDPDATDFADRWETAAFRTAGASGQGSDEARVGAQERLVLLHELKRTQPDPDGRAAVLFLQDRSNLVRSLAALKAARGGLERTAIIACEQYPMRDFLLDLVKDGNVDDRRYRPIAPRPREGLRELARLVFSRLVPTTSPSRNGLSGLPRGEAEKLFRDFRKSARHPADGHSPTRQGLKGLLDSQFDPEHGGFNIEEKTTRDVFALPALGVPSPDYDETIYVCPNALERAASMSPFVKLLRKATAGKSDQIGWIARDDRGLAYAARSVLSGGTGTRYEVDAIHGDGVSLELLSDASTNGNARSIERTVFCRTYALRLDRSEAEVADVDIRYDGEGFRLAWMGLVAPMQRLTHSTIQEETLAGKAPPGPTPLGASGESRRLEAPCFATVVRLLFSAATYPATSKKVAFTLQVAFADIIYSLFPAMAHRVAVISPQAAEIFATLSSHKSVLERNIGNRYPRFAEVVNGKVGIAEVDGPRMTQLFDPLVLKAFGEAGRPPVARDGEETIDIYLIEDWPSDLGVCNALRDRETGVLPMLLDYLDWLERNKDREDLYHCFGSKRLLDAFAYADAAALLRSVI